MTRSRILALLFLIFTCIIIIYPEVSFQASVEGLKLWLEIVLPAMLPFFVLADLLMGLGVVHFLGSLLEPIMRPVFRVPGIGGFALAMALAAGYPLGAKITGDLARTKQITITEAERLLSLANTASPLFMVGAVAVGMFGRADLGISLLIAHYTGAILVGFCMRLHRGPETPRAKSTINLWKKALHSLDQAREADGRSFGQLFGDTVRSTFQAMLFIGGCIMFFSVIVQVIGATGLLNPARLLVGDILNFAGLDANLSHAVINGFFETTLGIQTASRALAPLGAQVAITSLLLGWSGLSVHGQVTALISDTKIRLVPYLYARILHGVFAATITALLLGPASFIPTSLQKALPTLSTSSYLNGNFGARLLASARLATSFLLILVIALSLVWLFQRIIYISFRSRS